MLLLPGDRQIGPRQFIERTIQHGRRVEEQRVLPRPAQHLHVVALRPQKPRQRPKGRIQIPDLRLRQVDERHDVRGAVRHERAQLRKRRVHHLLKPHRAAPRLLAEIQRHDDDRRQRLAAAKPRKELRVVLQPPRRQIPLLQPLAAELPPEARRDQVPQRHVQRHRRLVLKAQQNAVGPPDAPHDPLVDTVVDAPQPSVAPPPPERDDHLRVPLHQALRVDGEPRQPEQDVEHVRKLPPPPQQRLRRHVFSAHESTNCLYYNMELSNNKRIT